MWLQIIIAGAVTILFMIWRQSRREKGNLKHIPGSTKLDLLWRMIMGTMHDPHKTHIFISQMADQYGPICKFAALSQTFVIASGYDSITKVTLKGGKDFSGRGTNFRYKTALEETGILASRRADDTWKTLRKTSQRHLRQFGEGLNRLESIICTIAEDMFVEFSNKTGTPIDPKNIIFDTALNSIAFLIAGERTRSGDNLVEMMREYERLFMVILPTSAPLTLRLLDLAPWLRHLGLPSWNVFKRFLQLEQDIWTAVNEMNDVNPESESVCRVLRKHVTNGPNQGNVALTEIDARKSSLSLLLAGVTTTSRSFYALVNILAHNMKIQHSLLQEIKEITNNTRDIILDDRKNMPYARATIFEVLRYISIVPLGVQHCTSKQVDLNGYVLPPDTLIIANQWSLHHDIKFWGDPFTFRPERFLDDAGDLVPPDHPNRKMLMPFGAGPRVCLGESLALTRLFLWMTTLIQRFQVEPAAGNQKECTDPSGYHFEGVLSPTQYKVIFIERM